MPGYRAAGKALPPPDAAFLDRAWSAVANAAAKANVTVILGTERIVDGSLLASALVIRRDGTIAGFQDKVQLDPSEDGTYSAGSERHVFEDGTLKFGIAICHEGWRYPETVRWAATRGAHIVFHPHFDEPEPGDYAPSTFADPPIHSTKKLHSVAPPKTRVISRPLTLRARGLPTTSAVVRPDGTLLAYQPYGVDGLLIADIDISTATGLLSSRCKYG